MIDGDDEPTATAADPEGSAPLPLPSDGLPPGDQGASAEEMSRVRRVPLAWLSLAAVLVVLAVLASSVVLLGRPDAQRVEIVLASLGGGEPATATLRDAADGRTLEVTLPEARATSGSFYELWLIDADVEGMVSLGPVAQGQTTVVVPDGLDLSRFPIVDVSVEPFDGEPRHSGNSRWRGTVPA